MQVETLNELQQRAMGVVRGRYSAAFVEDGTLVVKVRTTHWWVEVYGPAERAGLPRVDSEMAPYRYLIDALSMHRELLLWALGGG